MIQCEHITFRYAGRKRPCLVDVSFEIAHGETVLMLGPSGCGKSTLALCLNGLIPHVIEGEFTGSIRINGIDIRSLPISTATQNVGLLFQDPDMQFCMLRVDDEIAFGLENMRMPRDAMVERVHAAMHLAGLMCVPSTRIDTLSGGNKQRLALACVLAMSPRVLVFDEPASQLDPRATHHVVSMIEELKARGEQTLVLIEHQLDHVMRLIDRILVFGPDGTMLDDGEPHHVLERQGAELDRFGIWIPQVTELATQLRHRGVTFDGLPITMDEAARTFRPLADARPPAVPLPMASDGDVVIPPNRHSASGRQDNSDAPPAVVIRNLSHRYGRSEPVLRDVSLTIPAGDFVGIVGPNGAGKSTLAHHLIGTFRPPRGHIFLQGHDIRSMSSRSVSSIVGYVFQNPEHQFVTSTVFDELAYGLRLRARSESDVQEQVRATLADFGLLALERANPFRLSHGEKRRLSVATMLVLGQDIVVLDEPTIGQDRRNAAMLMSICQRLHRSGKTIVMITHDMRLLAEYARSVVVMVDGRVAFTGSPASLFEDAPLLAHAHLGVPPMLELSRLLFPDPKHYAFSSGAAWPATVSSLVAALTPAPVVVTP